MTIDMIIAARKRSGNLKPVNKNKIIIFSGKLVVYFLPGSYGYIFKINFFNFDSVSMSFFLIIIVQNGKL